MKTITTVLDEQITLTGNEWFVTMTDKFLTGWGCAKGKIAKRIVVCQTHADAIVLKDRLANPKYKMTYVNVVKDFPYYNPSRYTISIDKYNNKLFTY